MSQRGNRRFASPRSIPASEGVDQDEEEDQSGPEDYDEEKRGDAGRAYDELSSQEELERVTEAQLLPGDAEKKSVLNMFDAMRKDSYFCDVAMISQGVLFRAHRVVVSSWSRWLRAILCESPDEEVVSFDFFEPQAFGAVLDYMYGIPLLITVDNADSLIKVIRRLELQKLEQQCWRFLMTAINPDNVEKLHELADRYDCPPLKLAAWRMIQETKPGYSTSPSMAKMLKNKEMQEYVQAILGVTGLTGPGEPGFNTMVTISKDGAAYAAAVEASAAAAEATSGNSNAEDEQTVQLSQHEIHDAIGAIHRGSLPSVFDDHSVEEEEEGEDEDGEDEDDEQSEVESDGEQGIIYRKKGAKKRSLLERQTDIADPDQLDSSATATDVIKAWATRLKRVYDDCTAEEEAAEYEDEDDFRIAPNSSNVRLHSGFRTKRSDLLGGRKQSAGSRAADAADRAALVEEKRQRMREDLLGPPVSSSPSHPRRSPNGSLRVPPPRGRRPEAPLSPSTQFSSFSAESRAAESIRSTGAGAGGTSNRRIGSRKQSAPLEAFITALDGKKRAINWRQELENFYIAIDMREKIDGISTILDMWVGKEDQMLNTLVDKYRDLVPSSTLAHIEHVLNVMETQTESSFVATGKSSRR